MAGIGWKFVDYLHVMISAILAGLLAGLIHVLSGPDHLAAIAPLSADRRRAGWQIGFRWGLGHSLGVLLIGFLSLAMRGLLPLDLVSGWAERTVGMTLIGVGLWGLRNGLRNRVHSHEHAHGGPRHAHFHFHGRRTAHEPEKGTGLAELVPANRVAEKHRHSHAATLIGILHGLAGSSHIWGVLPALAFSQESAAISYLVSFGLGTVAGMSCFSSVIGWISSGFQSRGVGVHRALMTACSLAAIFVGAYWLMF